MPCGTGARHLSRTALDKRSASVAAQGFLFVQFPLRMGIAHQILFVLLQPAACRYRLARHLAEVVRARYGGQLEAADLDEVVTRLDDPRQRDALLAMRRARWAGEGDPASARAALRTAFRDGPRWRPATAVDAAPLPPLYPPR